MKEVREERRVQGKKLPITYTLIRKKVKNINMRISREGKVSISAPAGVPKGYLDDFVLSKEDKLIQLLEEYEKRKENSNRQPQLLYGEDIFEQICSLWYPCINSRYPIPYPIIQIRKMKSRWGTCHVTKKKIILNRELLRAPLRAIEYVVLHELAHFVHANHSAAFYQVIQEIMPDWKERKELLKQIEI